MGDEDKKEARPRKEQPTAAPRRAAVDEVSRGERVGPPAERDWRGEAIRKINRSGGDRVQAWLDSIHKDTPEENERIRTTIRHIMNPLTIEQDKQAEADRKLAELARQREIIQRHLGPRDGGEIDGPPPGATREPVVTFRGPEMTEEQRQAYVETVRRAQANAKK